MQQANADRIAVDDLGRCPLGHRTLVNMVGRRRAATAELYLSCLYM